ncbi:MAG: DUF3347 domain-containing protein [Deltaproteobacteria bacterium]|nr:DUF3347 domain-containing protein [Deltaproteobacteria bacterium]
MKKIKDVSGILLMAIISLSFSLYADGQTDSHRNHQTHNNLMDEFITTYHEMHTLLIKDSLEGIQKKAQKLNTLLNQLSAEKLQLLAAPIKNAQEAIKLFEENSLAKAREGFSLYSEFLIQYLTLGVNNEKKKKLTVFSCPMTPTKFKKWLQKDDKIQNPYVGKDMLDCGTKENL